jgi:tetratricopeptide (TPR) repeat protein
MEEAQADLAEALSLNPSYAEAHNNLGTIYARQGLFSEAIVHCGLAAELGDQNGARNVAILRAQLGVGEGEQSHSMYRKALEKLRRFCGSPC